MGQIKMGMHASHKKCKLILFIHLYWLEFEIKEKKLWYFRNYSDTFENAW